MNYHNTEINPKGICFICAHITFKFYLPCDLEKEYELCEDCIVECIKVGLHKFYYLNSKILNKFANVGYKNPTMIKQFLEISLNVNEFEINKKINQMLPPELIEPIIDAYILMDLIPATDSRLLDWWTSGQRHYNGHIPDDGKYLPYFHKSYDLNKFAIKEFYYTDLQPAIIHASGIFNPLRR